MSEKKQSKQQLLQLANKYKKSLSDSVTEIDVNIDTITSLLREIFVTKIDQNAQWHEVLEDFISSGKIDSSFAYIIDDLNEQINDSYSNEEFDTSNYEDFLEIIIGLFQ